MENTSELKKLVAGSVLEHWQGHAAKFQAAKPFRHIAIDDFLTDSFCAALCDQFPAFDEEAAMNENGLVGGKATQEQVKSLGSAYTSMDHLVSHADFLGLIEKITGVSDLCYDPHYIGGGTHENCQGQDLDAHIDFNYHPITQQHRRLNVIIYLNDEWQDEWGGSLQLHRDPYLEPAEDDITTITSKMNRCVIFETSEHSWHGFERIELPADQQHRSRKSFALYYYTDERPEEETAVEHSTVYVERHLPGRFKSGMTLAENDVQDLRVLLKRRDQHLQRLYSNIQQLHGEYNPRRFRTVEPPSVPMAESDSGVNGADESVDGSVDVSAGDLDSLTSKLTRQGREIAALRSRVHELEHSHSWQVTAPLRAVRRKLKGTS